MDLRSLQPYIGSIVFILHGANNSLACLMDGEDLISGTIRWEKRFESFVLDNSKE